VLPALRESGLLFADDRDPYPSIARSLAAGRGYVLDPGPHPTLRRMPGYPLLLAGLLQLACGRENVAALLQVLLVAGSTALCFATLRSAGAWAAGGGALALGMHPLTIVYSSRFYSESLSLFLTAVSLFLLARVLSRRRLGDYLAFSMSLAAGWLTRTTIVIWAVPSLVALLLHPTFRSRPLAWAVGPALAVTLVVPWIARNRAVTGELVAGSSWNARSALHGLRNAVDPAFGSHPRETDDATMASTSAAVTRIIGPVDSAAKELQEDRLATRWLLSELLVDPGKRAGAFARGLVRSFYLTSSRPVRLLAGIVNLCLLALAALGWLLGRGQRPLELHCWLLVGTFWLFHAFVFPLVRYQMPAIPALALLAGIGLERARTRLFLDGSRSSAAV
jgi:hypothetical protein